MRSIYIIVPACFFLFFILSSHDYFERESTMGSFVKKVVSNIYDASDDHDFYARSNARVTYFSENIISFFMENIEHTGLPHEIKQYETRNFFKKGSRFYEKKLSDLFCKKEQVEFIKNYCEMIFKKIETSYFYGKNAIKNNLNNSELSNYYFEKDGLVIVFQPYVVGSSEDGPFLVKIPYEILKPIVEADHIIHLIVD